MDLGNLTGGMTFWNIIGGLVFSGVGLVAFMWGKKHGRFKPMVLGGALMAYPYFVSNTALMYLIGAALTVAAVFLRD